jgi:hypothetical protein
MSDTIRIGLIASGTFLSDGLSAELGRIAPCLVPLGNDHLLYHQHSVLQNLADRIFVSLPEGYDLHPMDQKRIEGLGIEIIYSDPSLKIGESIANCINSIGLYDHELLILYGDTLIKDLDSFPRDAVSIHQSRGEYSWAALDRIFGVETEQDSHLTLSGLFSFSNIPNLLRAIVRAKGDFLEAIRLYSLVSEIQLVNKGDWFDFGHVQTYFQSTGLVTTQRGFNSLQITKSEVLKASHKSQKMKAEAGWFNDIPPHMSTFTPAFLGERQVNGMFGYATANTYLSTLANLAVFGDLKTITWNNILGACAEFLRECRKVTPKQPIYLSADEYFGSKTIARIDEFSSVESGARMLSCYRVDGRAVPSISEILVVTNEIIRQADHGSECMIHGDFCFSNIFYDFRSTSIKVIDPRGELPDGTRSIYGLQSYDIAKLAHSIIGGYDLIIANYVHCEIIDGTMSTDMSFLESIRWQRLVRVFADSEIASIHSRQTLNAMLVHLFLSMLPLHGDRPDRQAAMLAMAYKFYQLIEE